MAMVSSLTEVKESIQWLAGKANSMASPTLKRVAQRAVDMVCPLIRIIGFGTFLLRTSPATKPFLWDTICASLLVRQIRIHFVIQIPHANLNSLVVLGLHLIRMQKVAMSAPVEAM